MAGSFPSDSLGLGLASIGSPGDGGTQGDHGGLVDECGDGDHGTGIVVMVLMVTIAVKVVM